MYYLDIDSIDPYYNLALEEYIFINAKPDDPVFLLWQNQNTIVVGKYQNTVEEINQDFVRENNVRVVRRITGGGAVYHDLGNLNFSFMQRHEALEDLDFRVFTQPVAAVLHKLGVEAEFNGRNDLSIEGKKFSGNAQTIKDCKILHHGTLMFDSNLDFVENALNVKPDKLVSKGVRSVRSRVTNISDHLSNKIGINEFRKLLLENMFAHNSLEPYKLSGCDLDGVKKLRNEKYATWAWNYGFSPEYDIKKYRKFDFGGVTVCIKVMKGGSIAGVSIFGDFFGSGDLKELESRLTGLPLRESAVRCALDPVPIGSYIRGMDAKTLTEIIVY